MHPAGLHDSHHRPRSSGGRDGLARPRRSVHRGERLMPLVCMPDLLARARDGAYAVGYFESWDLPSLEAVLDAAELEQSPVIVGFGGMMVDAGWLVSRGVAMLGRAARVAVEEAYIPAALMFNEAQGVAQISA
ncbi:MAG: hypothetical protein FJX72_13680, partial [Armatimonadetes bacterium]|nr:hypothetical protein [Armatimonadota bacterium]